MKQTTFLITLLEYDEDWVPKDHIMEQIAAAVGETSSHTLDGVQSSMTRRCQTAGNEKFWERRRQDGQWAYRVKPQYQDVAEEYWLS